MESPPVHADIALCTLILRTVGEDHDSVCGMLHFHNGNVAKVEKWFRELPYQDAVAFCSDRDIRKQMKKTFIPKLENNELLVKVAELDADSILCNFREDFQSMTRVSERRKQGHWDDLTKVAEELSESLAFRSRSLVMILNSVVDGETYSGGWRLEKDKAITFSAEGVFLYPMFCEHLASEFPQFTLELKEFKELSTEYIHELGLGQGTEVAASGPGAKGLRQLLHLVRSRRTFQGVCKICRSWA